MGLDANVTIISALQSSGIPSMTYRDMSNTLKGLSEFYYADRESYLFTQVDSMEFQIRRDSRVEALGNGTVARRHT